MARDPYRTNAFPLTTRMETTSQSLRRLKAESAAISDRLALMRLTRKLAQEEKRHRLTMGVGVALVIATIFAGNWVLHGRKDGGK